MIREKLLKILEERRDQELHTISNALRWTGDSKIYARELQKAIDDLNAGIDIIKFYKGVNHRKNLKNVKISSYEAEINDWILAQGLLLMVRGLQG